MLSSLSKDATVFRDKHGRRVYVYRPGKWDPDKVNFCDVFCGGYMLCEMVSREEKTQIAGVTCVADGSNFGFKQFRNTGFNDLKWSAAFIQETFPLWFRSIHMVNASRMLTVLYNMIKPLFSQRIQESIFIHDSFESLHQHVSLECLPEELGGNAGPFDNTLSAKAVKDIPEYFKQIKTYVYDK